MIANQVLTLVAASLAAGSSVMLRNPHAKDVVGLVDMPAIDHTLVARKEQQKDDMQLQMQKAMGFGTSKADKATFENLSRFSKLMSIASCVARTNGLKTTAGKFDAAHCDEFDMDLIKVFANPGPAVFPVSGYLAADHAKKELVFALRGAMPNVEVMSDMDVLQVPLVAPNTTESSAPLDSVTRDCPKCRMHQGFYEAYKQAFSQIGSDLHKALDQHPDYKLYVIGHSLGGAVAQMFGASLKLQNQSNFAVITAGSPMVGNREFANWVNALFKTSGDWGSDRDYYRVTHIGDVIPRAPFWNGYHQTAGEVYITKVNGTEATVQDLQMCNGGENPECSWGHWNTHLSEKNKQIFETLLFGHRDYFVRMGDACEKRTTALRQNCLLGLWALCWWAGQTVRWMRPRPSYDHSYSYGHTDENGNYEYRYGHEYGGY